MRLVQGIKRAWQWHSVQVLAVLSVLPMVWVELPADIKSRIPSDWIPYILALLAIAGLVGRLRDQS